MNCIYFFLTAIMTISFIRFCFYVTVLGAATGLEQQGPMFLLEPPTRVEFSNSSGGRIDCSAHGSPAPRIEWTLADGSPALPVPQLRRVHPNGSLEFPAFPAERYRHDVHTALYRCRVRNQLGEILSRDVHVRAGQSLFKSMSY
jgi:hypothetical protein